ncbi:MAG: 2,4-dihydroxyhept-2-ene-1,7-dioic acid aldolase, partial [SAR202 cluster bacterium]|nr:2,4-dihydroxyhept-2-ene-1,7-dioic acid aldolase [SAR202 cluster bacterium]
MRANKVKALWKQGKPVAVGWVSSADTYVAEVLANAGFDALVLDMQHGMGIGPDRAALWLQAVSTTNTVPMVRVPWNEPWYMQWVLDAGAYGVIVPLVNSREEAAKAGGACRYPPLGYRSMGPNRARLYGGVDYFQNANQEIACLVMVEDLRTVDQIDELAKAPGIDGFYIGPADLAISMGVAP